MAATMTAHVIVCSMPFVSHFTPMLTISRHLVDLGYQVTFITSSKFCDKIQNIGAAFAEPSGWGDFHDDTLASKSQGAPTDPYARANWNVTTFFIKTIPAQIEAIQSVITFSLASDPSKPIVVLPESSFHGALPILLEAPGQRPNGIAHVGIFPILALSIDTAPPASGILPSSSPEGQKRNEELNKTYVDLWGPMQRELNSTLASLGARGIEEYRHNAVISLSDIFLQLCPPSLEYPRSDIPPSLRFTGGLPRDPPSVTHSTKDLPSWWSEIIQNSKKERKKIIAVSQGTMTLNYRDLIIPTLNALANSPDILVLVALGKKGAALPEDFVVPGNARVADWIPFDDLLAVSDCFVTNGGYGSFQNSVSRGVPLVVAAPLFADKRDIADRVEWSGVGIPLKTGTPSPDAVREAVLEVLEEGKYRRRVEEVRGEIRGFDPMKVIADAVDELAGR
ncbi:related to N-glycosyltransferase [Phialocephala subalpina]|uniref:Related to N-glycosyltransferase n=1 Tax=Phialocephala subalpina TaxID=576137 RepID=A0A1L7XQ64_9HELO|nr:related to N-glycosyltransferase [Phialocephala subalpina]